MAAENWQKKTWWKLCGMRMPESGKSLTDVYMHECLAFSIGKGSL